MNVLIVHNAYQSHLSGGEDAVFMQEVEALKQTLGEQHVWTYVVSNDHLKVWQLPLTIWHHHKHAKAIETLCKTHKIDLVHVHNFFPMLTASVFTAAKKAGAKVVHTLHNYRWWCLSGTLFYKLKPCHRCLHKRFAWLGVKRGCYRGSKLQSLMTALAFAFYKRAKVQKAIDVYIALSEHQRYMLSQVLPPKKILLKPNGILPISVAQTQRQGYVFVGRLEAGKGIEHLLKVWSTLVNPERLTIIGSGPLATQLKQQYASEHIQFLGNVPFEQVSHELAKAKFCIHPSLYYETFGLVILESMMRGTPVIGFKIGTRPEFIRHGVNGLLTTPEHLSRLIQHINRYDYVSMSTEARRFARGFSMQTMIQKQIQSYQTILEDA